MIFSAEGFRKLKTALSFTGLSVRFASSVRPINLTTEKDIPAPAAVYEGRGRPVLINAPLVDCRHMYQMGFNCSADSKSPFIRTLVLYSQGKCKNYANSPLEMYYKRFQPDSASELMGLDQPENYAFNEAHPMSALLPWMTMTPQDHFNERKRIQASESRQHGIKKSKADEESYFGPVSETKGKLEFKRLVKVYNSISKHGYRIDKEGIHNIRCIILASRENPDHAAYWISSGNHRTAALAALGYENITVQTHPEGLGGIVYREDVRHWPTVRRGYLTEKEALMIFDRIFSGQQPQAFQDI